MNHGDLSYLIGVSRHGPAPQHKAKPSDRRALSRADVDDLLGTSRAPSGPYDPTFWDEFYDIVRRVAKAQKEPRVVAWRIKRDFEFLRKMGWTPSGVMPVWEQLAIDIAEGLLPFVDKSWAKRLKQTIRWLGAAAEVYPALYKVDG